MLLTTVIPQENILPPTTKSPPIPAPPTTCNAPLLVEVADVKLLIKNVLVVPVDVADTLMVTTVPELVTISPSPTKSSKLALLVNVVPCKATAILPMPDNGFPPGVMPSERRSSPVNLS